MNSVFSSKVMNQRTRLSPTNFRERLNQGRVMALRRCRLSTLVLGTHSGAVSPATSLPGSGLAWVPTLGALLPSQPHCHPGPSSTPSSRPLRWERSVSSKAPHRLEGQDVGSKTVPAAALPSHRAIPVWQRSAHPMARTLNISSKVCRRASFSLLAGRERVLHGRWHS